MTLIGLAVLCLYGCHRAVAPTVAAAPPVVVARDALNNLVERYWDETQSSNPWSTWGLRRRSDEETPDDMLDTQALADALAIERRYLGELLGMPRAQLDADSQATFDMFRRERESAIEGFTFPAELMPIDPYEGFPLRVAMAAQAAEGLALSGGPSDRWQTLVTGYAHWTAQAIANMREGVRRGYTLPLVVVERALPMLAALGSDTESNAFYLGLKAPAGAGESAATPALRSSIQSTLLPAFRSLHDYLQREYLPRARTSIGLAALPMGAAWYAYLVRRTVGAQTARDLQAQAAAELPRLHARLQALLGEAAFNENAQAFVEASRHDPRFAFGNAQELSSAYAEVKARVQAALPALFATAPLIEIDIRPADEYLQTTGDTMFYSRSPSDHESAALIFFNAGKLDGLPAMAVAAQYLQLAEPGRLYQLSVQSDRTDLPRFRRYGDVATFSQGWALYASSLGDELGMYRNPQEKFAALYLQLACATGVGVDVGIHSQTWNRKQALDYVHAQMPVDDELAANLVDRVIARPGAALACSVGHAKIQALRALAQQALASRFDVRAFHTQVLNAGAVPMDMLDSDIRRWITAELAAPPPVD